jgi:hypothetical protein
MREIVQIRKELDGIADGSAVFILRLNRKNFRISLSIVNSGVPYPNYRRGCSACMTTTWSLSFGLRSRMQRAVFFARNGQARNRPRWRRVTLLGSGDGSALSMRSGPVSRSTDSCGARDLFMICSIASVRSFVL